MEKEIISLEDISLDLLGIISCMTLFLAGIESDTHAAKGNKAIEYFYPQRVWDVYIPAISFLLDSLIELNDRIEGQIKKEIEQASNTLKTDN